MDNNFSDDSGGSLELTGGGFIGISSNYDEPVSLAIIPNNTNDIFVGSSIPYLDPKIYGSYGYYDVLRMNENNNGGTGRNRVYIHGELGNPTVDSMKEEIQELKDTVSYMKGVIFQLQEAWGCHPDNPEAMEKLISNFESRVQEQKDKKTKDLNV